MPVCKLCLLDKQLIKRSHIIPDAMYKLLYDKDHKLRKFAPADLLNSDPLIQRPSSGIYEGGLLCADCDNHIIGGYESYGNRILYASAKKDPLPTEIAIKVKRVRNVKGQEFGYVSKVDYKRFKLFLLSILWRASISTRPEFEEVNLGDQHTEMLRRMIYEGDPGEPRDYPIRFETYLNDDAPIDVIVPPVKGRLFNKISYLFTITGIFFIFQITSGRPIDSETEEHTLRPEGTFTLLFTKKGTGMEHLLRLSNALPRQRL